MDCCKKTVKYVNDRYGLENSNPHKMEVKINSKMFTELNYLSNKYRGMHVN